MSGELAKDSCAACYRLVCFLKTVAGGAGSLGSNGEQMEGRRSPREGASGLERQPGNGQHNGYAANGPGNPGATGMRSGDPNLVASAARQRGEPCTSDIATSHPRQPPSPSASNASCGQAHCNGGPMAAAPSFDSRVPNSQACPAPLHHLHGFSVADGRA